MIVRGVPEVPIRIGDYSVPSSMKMKLFKFIQNVDPLEWVPIVDIPNGKGLFFMQTLAVQSGNLNFLEGCFHQYTPYDQPFPGTIISTGTEDYFDSAWYFNGGEFRFPVSGFTHLDIQNETSVTWSAYRFHEMDPLPFANGYKMYWRNGDLVDAVGQKCRIKDNAGAIVGSPTSSSVTAYAWVYLSDD